MKVSDLARRAGIAPSAVRYYEAAGAMPPAPRGPSGYREYAEIDVCRLRVVVALRSLGLELHEAGRLAAMCGEGRCDDMAVDLLPRIVARRLEVANARAELDHLDTELAALERTLRDGNPRSMLTFNVERKDEHASSDQTGCCR